MRPKKCEKGCGRYRHDFRIGDCVGRDLTVLQQASVLWYRTLGPDYQRDVHLGLISLMLKLEPSLLIHVMHQAVPLCGRSRPYDAGRNVWPETEIWVGLDHTEFVNCPGCLAAISDALVVRSLERGFRQISSTLDRIGGRR